MEDGRPSATAERAALLRAAHQLLDEPRILDDPIVLRLLGAARTEAIALHPDRFQTPPLRSLRASMALRSRWAEDCLCDAVRHGVRQYVILGAGLDSFAYRSPFPDLRVYEVDHPATQAWKRRLLRQAAIEPPACLTFVPVDFERQTPREVIVEHGLDSTSPTFVSWLGVTVYLTREAIVRTLADVSALAPGSEVVFEYLVPPSLLSEPVRAAVAAVAARAAAAGEPWLTTFAPAELAHLLAQLGFTLIEDVGPELAFERHFHGRSDGLRPGRSAHLVRARIGG